MKNNLYYFRAADVYYYDHGFCLRPKIGWDTIVNYTWRQLKRWL